MNVSPEIDGLIWQAQLRKTPTGSPKPIMSNAAVALREAPEWQGVIGHNRFAYQTMMTAPPPWMPYPNGTWQDQAWTSGDDLRTTEWLQLQNILVSSEVAAKAVELVAAERSFHPVRDYLGGLTWDGKPRVDGWAVDFLGAADSDYIQTVSRCALIAAVARIYEPGCKADCVPILEGVQGAGKSTLAKAMFDPWFTDELADLGSKDSAMQTAGVWCIEIAELDAMTRGEVSKTKAFITRTTDRFRPPYGARLIEAPRSCVFWGTTNSQGYLKDETGGRRFWPIKCGKLNIAGLRANRDQLWAEAVHLYRANVAWWFVNPNVQREAEAAQGDRYQTDPWDDPIDLHLSMAASVSVPGLLAMLGVATERQTQADATRVARMLTSRGWVRFQVREGGKRSWRYRRADAPEEAPSLF